MTKKLAEKVWIDGALVDWEHANIHISSHVVHYGSSVFEGIRAYNIGGVPNLFRYHEHMERLMMSAKIYRMPVPYTQTQLEQAGIATVKANGFKACYLRPIIFRDAGAVGVNPLPASIKCAILTWEWGAYLGPEALEKGVDVCVSSWHRISPNTHAGLAKAGGNYLNSQLVRMEAAANGYVEGIMLNSKGHVSEGSGENIFLVRKERIITPPLGASILAGITRDAIFKLAHDLNYEIMEQEIPRETLYIADEVFFTGTAAEVTPIRSIDRITIGRGSRGPVTERLQKELMGILHGETPDRHGWLTPVA